MMNKNNKHEFNIFDILAKIRDNNVEFFLQLTDEQLKSLAPYVLMLWLTDTNNHYQLQFLNQFVNKYVYQVSDKRLLLLLLIASVVDPKMRYRWTRKKKQRSTKKLFSVVSQAYKVNEQVCKQYLDILSSDQIEQICTYSGLDKKETKEVLKQFKQYREQQ